MHVFVYGTLKRGYSNNRLLEGAKFVGEAFTIGKYARVDAGFPVVVEGSDEAFAVAGEVYDIKGQPDILKRLDFLEHEGTMYDRKEVVVYLPGKKKRLGAFIYVGCPDFWGDRDHSNDKYYTSGGKLSWPAGPGVSVGLTGL
jgi:gamma-glutamylcyclotransferase (GGCT)/AIG2-like uncharacterized protein YtfP